MKKTVILFALPLLILAASAAQAEGEFSRWHLDITWGEPDFVTVPGRGPAMDLCWYMTYEVTNNTEQEIPLGLRIKAKTDTKKVYVDAMAPRAQKILQAQTGKKYRNARKMTQGTIAPGETILAVAFFGEIDANYDWLRIHVGGLYDTIAMVDGKLFHENKVLVLSWYRPGDEYGAAADVLTFKGKKWIIEGERTEIPQLDD